VHKLSAVGEPLAEWGGTGADPGQFKHPGAVVVDHQGRGVSAQRSVPTVSRAALSRCGPIYASGAPRTPNEVLEHSRCAGQSRVGRRGRRAISRAGVRPISGRIAQAVVTADGRTRHCTWLTFPPGRTVGRACTLNDSLAGSAADGDAAVSGAGHG
jgi:hypothetical protein